MKGDRRPRRRPDRQRFDISPEAQHLIETQAWELVELADGPAAQAVVAGVRPLPSRYRADPEPDEGEAPDDHPDLFEAP